MSRSLSKILVDGMDMPGECLPGQPLLELYGEDRVLVENHLGITEYGSERIRVRVRYGGLCITGRCLHLCRMQNRQLVIMGKIQTISLDRGG